MEDIEDYYSYYVTIQGISEELFWNCDISFIDKIAENDSAYNEWKNYILEKERERIGRK